MCEIFTKKCILGNTANREVCLGMVYRSLGLADPHIGYAKTSEIVQKVFETGKLVGEIDTYFEENHIF